MSSLQFTVSIFSLVSIGCSLAPSDCNYVVDIWALDANPPSASPTPEPSRSPSKSPTYSPTSTSPITTDILPTEETAENDISVLVGLPNMNVLSSIAVSTFNYCYVRNGLFPDPWNTFSMQYECDGDNLVRKIYWDSIVCDDNHDDIQITTYLSTESHFATSFLCGQPTNCDAAYLRTLSADTMEPTPAPTESPIIPIGTTQEGALQTDERKGEDWNCTNIIGPSANPVIDIEVLNPIGICISVEELGVFNASDADIGSFGWSCVDEQFVFAIYNDTSCVGYSMGVSYANNSCMGALWTYVDCHAYVDDGGITTEHPTAAPVEYPDTLAPSMQDVGSTDVTAPETTSMELGSTTTEVSASTTEWTTTAAEASTTGTVLVTDESSDESTTPRTSSGNRFCSHVLCRRLLFVFVLYVCH
eukprot:169688_1